jgi:hypothetical protein
VKKRVSFRVYAEPSVGEASIEVNCTADGSSYSDKTDITVRPATSLQKISDNGVIAGGSSRNNQSEHKFYSCKHCRKITDQQITDGSVY